jgi:hypothetical protein
MRRRALTLVAFLAAGVANATVDKIESCGTTWGGNDLPIARGVANDVTITGGSVDLSTSVDTTLPGVTITVLSRKNGFGSNIVLRFVAPPKGDQVDGVVTLHYLVGQESFPATLYPGIPTISSISFVPGPGIVTSGGTTRVTSLDTHVVSIRGSRLDTLNPRDTLFADAHLQHLTVVSQVSSELRLSFTSDAGDRKIDASLFTPDAWVMNCKAPLPDFVLSFTVFDPPRTPTPTPTPTATRTPTPRLFAAPLHITPGIPPGGFHPAPTPTPK